MTRRTTRVLCWMTGLMLAAATPALADSHEGHGKGHEKSAAAGKNGTGPSAETRAKMADAHDKMAACLRSTRPISECHAEMKKAHHDAGHGCDCAEGHHGKGECSEHGSEHGAGHDAHGKSKGKGGQSTAPAPTSTPTTSGPTQ